MPGTAGPRPPTEPIAIIGMACRFPGAEGVEAFWQLLEDGTDAVSEGVPGSGVGRIGTMFPDGDPALDACRFGAFVDGIDLFDAEFFRISALEAQLLDPSQRLMLETSWQALEDAGLDPGRLDGSRTGVYAGMSNNDYRHLILRAGEVPGPAAGLYSITGTSLNTAIGRVAFALGLEGPAMVVDTACSSSLVAIHEAVGGLHNGESDLALVGGVQVFLLGRLTEMRARGGMLSPDGRCKAFDASANGFVRGEGCGMVVLKRLSEAEADGDHIWGVITGSAVNQDGASGGLTVPRREAQERVIIEALARAGIRPWEVDYLEAHGTGTPVGDPIELTAAASAYGTGRSEDSPLLIGSVKTNFGHLESAAGVAGLMKLVLAIKRGTIPKHLHFREPTPQVDWDSLPVQVTSSETAWPQHADRPPRGAVNSFGFSGTNAHVIVEGHGPANGETGIELTAGPARAIAVHLPETPAELPEPDPSHPRRRRLLPLSGRSPAAVGDLAERYLAWLDERDAEHDCGAALADLAWTAGVGRSHFAHRAGLAFEDTEELRARLQAVVDTEATGSGSARTAETVAFVYTGQGAQWPGMGADLYETEPVFRAVLDRCEEVFGAERGESLLDVLFGRPGAAGDLHDPSWTQPAVYAFEAALAAQWASVGIRPDVVVGHSLGEIAAAHTAGVFGLSDGLRFAATRGALMESLPGQGAMGAVFAPESQVAAAVEEYNSTSDGVGVSIAADNGTHQSISGPAEGVEALLQRFESEGLRVHRLRATTGFHSALVEPALADLAASLEGVEVSPPSLTLVSSFTGRVLEPPERLDGAYWCRQTRGKVAFGSCIASLAALGVDTVIEIGPHAVLGPMIALSWPEASGEAPAVLASVMRPAKDAPAGDRPAGFIEAVAGAYEAGLDPSFAGLFAGEERRRIALPGYPFQRLRYWIEAPRRRDAGGGHRLLGLRHESPRGEVAFETEMFAGDPAWLDDHRVFGRVVLPGALHGAMAAAASFADGAGSVVVEDMQLHSPMLFAEAGDEDAPDAGRRVQVVIDGAGGSRARSVEVFSRGGDEDGWTLHAECRIDAGAGHPPAPEQADLDTLAAGLPPRNTPDFYRARAACGIDLGPSFRSLRGLRSEAGVALAEVVLPEGVDGAGLEVHPVLLDGCFQVLSAARHFAGGDDEVTYMPFGWERLWLNGSLPERFVCHARTRESESESTASPDEPAEVLVGDLRFFASDGELLGGLDGFTVKRATKAALLSLVEGVSDLLYEVIWRDESLEAPVQSAGFLADPADIAAGVASLERYLADEGVGCAERISLLADLERLSQAYALAALEQLGWERIAGAAVHPGELRQELDIAAQHERLIERMLLMIADAGVLTTAPGGGLVVAVGAGDRLLDDYLGDPEQLAGRLLDRYPHGANELGLLRRCGAALADVLAGRADPLSLLFGTEPSAADLYRKAPASLAANRMLADAVAVAVANLPAERRVRILEIGAGTGSATEPVLAALRTERFDYTFTDLSAGFFAEAEERFAAAGVADFRTLDIESDPAAQGFEPGGFDLVITANVLHATRDLSGTLAHCRALLAPSGHLVALEGLRRRGYQDLTFGLLEGWWRFEDAYRADHALADGAVWRRALSDAGFAAAEILDDGTSEAGEPLGHATIVAQGPAEVTETAGGWLLVADEGGVAAELGAALAARNQTVLIATAEPHGTRPAEPRLGWATVDPEQRDSWLSLVENLAADVPLRGVVHLAALDGHGPRATAAELATDTRRAGAGALALLQALVDLGVTPAGGTWIVTRGAQVIERERLGQLAGAELWGVGKVVAHEAPHLQPRMVDLDPDEAPNVADLAAELIAADAETHVAYRGARRRVARLVRGAAAPARLTLPTEPHWRLAADPAGSLEDLRTESLSPSALAPGEVRVEVEAAGLNFRDVLGAMGELEERPVLGRETCGRISELGPGVTGLSVGDRVVGLAFGTFAPEVVTRAELVAPAPAGIPAAGLATVPVCFTTAALAFETAGLGAGEKVLIHAGAGGVGLAAIQLAEAAGAEVFATASAAKRDHLRALGVRYVFDSRTTAFGEQILEATGGAGVDVVLNSLTGEGFIDATLSCLTNGGRFVEIASRDIWSAEDMAAARPDVAYATLALDALKREDPAAAGEILGQVMERIADGELRTLPHTVWPLTEAVAAMEFMRSARHVGKIVLTFPQPARAQLRADGTYLVTGGLGGIGCAVAGWLADRGAGAIVLSGRRAPDTAAETAIAALRARGAVVQVELADVTDTSAVDEMLARIDATLPPLAGIIHSAGVLSDGSLTNQSWDRFETVLGPKVLGAWHLHRATEDLDLDLFVVFSSITGILGNAGQANHGAANAFLDQLARHRRARGLPGTAIAWGAWSGLGEAEEQRERIERQLAASGTGWMTPQQGLQALDHVLRHDVAAASVMRVDWATFGAHLDDQPPFLEDLLSAPAALAAGTSDPSADLLTQLRASPLAAREDLLVSFLQHELQAVLRLPAPPAPAVRFFDLGMDSLMAVEFRNRLNRVFAGEYVASSTVVFDYPDIAGLANHLASVFEEVSEAAGLPEPPDEAALARPPRAVGAGTSDGIAIVGMACRFPGAGDLASFWRLLEAGETAIADGRPDPGPWSGVVGDHNSSDAMYRRGAFVDGIDRFDAGFFRITPVEARLMDPQHRLLLETTWQALEDAGIDPASLKDSRTGTYAGVGRSEYRDLIVSNGRDDSFLGTSGSVAVGRIAFLLGLRGPAVPVDMSCSSALVAVHQAMAALRDGEIDMALVGGVNAVLSPALTRFLAEVGMLSPDGTLNTFDASANGFVRGEGCGMLVLKRLAEAEADGDRIWAVIKGSAVNQNGGNLGLTLPSGAAQKQVMAEALERAGVAPGEVDYLELHGPGTEVGDAVEVGAAAAVYGGGRVADRPLLIGSVKPNIGHLEWAAAIAGLIKGVLALQQKVIPRHLNLRNPNLLLDWDALPVRVTTTQVDWPAATDRPARAAVNVFAISGANAHVVLEEYRSPNGARPHGESGWPTGPPRPVPADGASPEPPARGGRRTLLLPLSAKSEAALAELAARYLAWLDEHTGETPPPEDRTDELLADMAWTACVGRSHFPHRAAVVFGDAESLRRGLAAVSAGERVAPTDVPPEGEAVVLAAEDYEAGRAISFARLFAGQERRRISLPCYPFQRERHWLDEPA